MLWDARKKDIPSRNLAIDEAILAKPLYSDARPKTRYYVASFIEPVADIANRIRGYWGVENKAHYVRDVTQGEDASRIRMQQLPQNFAVARNFALNVFRDNGFTNMAQAQRCCKFGLDALKRLFRME